MNTRTSGLMGQGGNIAFAVTVGLSLAPLLWSGRLAINAPEGMTLAALGLIYVVVGCFAPLEANCARRCWKLAGYFSVQAVVLGLMLSLSRLSGMAGLCTLPLVAQAVASLPPIPAVIYVAGLFSLPLSVMVWVDGTTDRLPGAAGGFLASFAFVIVFTRIAVREKHTREHAEKLAAELATANEQLREATLRAEELAMARERNRLAREIHDSLGHYLTTVAVQLEAARALFPTEPARALGAVEKAHGLAREALVDVRVSVGALRAEGPARPLVERLRELAEGEFGARVELKILGEVRRLAPELEHGLFRAAQEGLTNARKHAAAKRVTLSVDFSVPNRVVVSVEDDGRGCAEPTGGFGLTGLRERVALLGGTLTAGNGEAGGFALRVELST